MEEGTGENRHDTDGATEDSGGRLEERMGQGKRRTSVSDHQLRDENFIWSIHSYLSNYDCNLAHAKMVLCLWCDFDSVARYICQFAITVVIRKRNYMYE